MRLQPPGVSAGYTPVWPAATATDPAGTFSRGDVRRGAAIRGSTGAM